MRPRSTGASATTLSSADTAKSSGDKRGEQLFLEVSYSDPRDSKLYTEPGADPAADSLIYKLYVGGAFGSAAAGAGGEHYYYCRPYGHVYQSVEVKGDVAASDSGELNPGNSKPGKLKIRRSRGPDP